MPKFTIWIILLIVQLGVLYGLTRWGYHTSRLPYSVENFIVRNAVWKAFGKKNIKIKSLDDLDNRFDPSLEYFKSSRLKKYSGLVNSYEIEEDSLFLTLDSDLAGEYELTLGKKEVSNFCYYVEEGVDCIEPFPEVDVKEGFWIDVYKFEYRGKEDQYIILVNSLN
jgi:hypothetical protein